MQRFNKSTQAPVGTVFLLVLGLAILPFSLKAAGVRVSLSPRVSAVMDAWQQVAELFGANYQPGTAVDLSVTPESDNNPSIPVDTSIGQPLHFACAREFEPEQRTRGDFLQPGVSPLPARRNQCKAVPRRPVAAKQVASIVVASSLMKSQAVEALSGLRLEMDTRVELLKGIEKQLSRPDFAQTARFKNLPITKDLRVLVRTRRRAAASSEKTECKVYSALASERKRDSERASLISAPNMSPDYSEF